MFAGCVKLIVCVALPTLIVVEPAPDKAAYPVASVGVKSAVNTVDAFTEPGVHKQVAVYGVEVVEAMEEQPVIAVPPDLNVTAPGVLTDAVIVDGDKYVAVVALDGRARERVGVTCNSLD